MKLGPALGLGERGIVSLIGAGGKTSLMYTLARELTGAGRRVLTTTTTKIFVPGPEESHALIVARDPRQVVARARELLGESTLLTAAAESNLPANKLHGFDVGAIARIAEANIFDWIVIEADGAARRPLKACAGHEPVVPPFSTSVVAVAGLDAVARPLTEEWVFRSSIYARTTGLTAGEPVTAASIAAMLSHDMSQVAITAQQAEKIAFLNKADDNEARLAAEAIIDCLAGSGAGQVFDRVVVGQLHSQPVLHLSRSLS